MKDTSVITDNTVRIIALLNMEIFQAAACLSDKMFGDRSATVGAQNSESEALVVKMKEYIKDELVMDGDSV